MAELVEIAALIVRDAKAGARASAALSKALRERRFGASEAEQLSQLVYGALRRERRVTGALRELAVSPGASDDERLGVIAAAVLEGSLDVAAARAVSNVVAWERFGAADRALLGRVSAEERVALLGALPDWLAAQLCQEYGDQAEALASSLAEPAPRSLRVNALRTDVEAALQRLTAEGAQVTRGRFARRALRLSGAFNPFVTRAFHEGLFELQDEGSQIVCELVAPPPRGLVVDACAGAGGKALALAAQLEGRGKVLALDIDQRKLGELRHRARRAAAANVQAIGIDAAGALPAAIEALAGKVDRLLVDAPCSGTGVLRRNPEARARLSPEAVDRLALTQREIIERMLRLLAPGGRLIFATCSLLRAEGEALLDGVEADHPELEPVNLAEVYDRDYVERFVRSAPHRLRLLPHIHDTDGFFVSCLRRRRH
ncbi:MAG TPA: RsmB/NOP family class I SAM-dependent RNA methyltransferase [Polyangiaceae bacterium]|nr:RsmB/NOP family class I SAM-dependent RNA methyltransferase [Polyangiaceae bacterium]